MHPHLVCWRCTPLFFFSGCGEKEERRARWRRKRGLLQQTCNNLVSILLCSFVEHGAAWCSVVTLPILLAALRAGAGGRVSCVQIRAEMTNSAPPDAPALVRCLGMVRYGARFLLWVVCFNVQRCTAANLLRCASLFAVAAQCALWVRGGKCSVLSNREERSASLQRTTPLRQPSAPRSGSGKQRTMCPLFRTRPFAKRHHEPTK